MVEDERGLIMKRMTILSAAAAGLVLFAMDIAIAWNIQPVPSDTDKKIRSYKPWYRVVRQSAPDYVIARLTQPQHEEIAHRIFGCDELGGACGSPKPGMPTAPAAIIAGVRWNDSPPFTLLKTRSTDICPLGEVITIVNRPACWIMLYKDAEGKAKKGTAKYGNAPMALVLYRSHFGDMQFLHSMASGEQERAFETRQKIMAWAQFVYRIALGEIDRGTSIKNTDIPEINSLFTYRYDTVQTLFVNDAPREYRNDEDLHLFAMGVLIHMVSDSFVDSHVERGDQRGFKCSGVTDKRKPGPVKSFRTYLPQDASAHGRAESKEVLGDRIYHYDANVIDVGQTIMKYYSRKAKWEELRVYLDCVYDLADPNAPAGPGRDYQKKDNRNIDPIIIPSS
jgi:hypothetical protein